jgi:protease YdgD
MKKTGLMMGGAMLSLALALGGPAFAQDIDFGDDSSTFANDQQCDDPRFEGPGAALVRSPVDEMRDATDCQAAFEAGEITLIAEGGGDTPAPGVAATQDDIDFGDDSGNWANDGECDDPRFGGGLASHELADATDCRNAYEAGEVTFDDGSDAAGEVTIDGIDFGDDSGNWANDGECDDPRFTGSGVGVALDDHLMADATDCSTAYEDGTVTFDEDGGSDDSFRINFGDDSSANANDGVCDDPRFQGRGGASELRDTNMMADATDCRAAYDAGTVTYNP